MSQAEKRGGRKPTIGQKLLRTVGLCLIAMCPACEAFAEFSFAVIGEMINDDDNVYCDTIYEPSQIQGHIWAVVPHRGGTP